MANENVDTLIRIAPAKRRPDGLTVTGLTGLGKSTIYRMMAEGKFPKPVQIAGAWAVRWRLSDVRAWMENQMPAGAELF